MAEGLPENQITHFTVQGHSHDGINSTKVDFTGYDIFDFITEGDLRRLILGVVNENTLEPRGGIIINPGPGGTGEGVFIGPDVPAPATGLASTCSINEDGATVRTVTWNKIDNATSYIIELYRSIDSGSNYLKIQEIETPYLHHSFEAAPMANVTQTRYKLIVRGKSSAGISGVNQEITGIQPCVDNIPPAGPKFEDAASPAPPNFFVSFRGFLARLQEQTEADTKWGIGQFEYSVSESLSSEGQWIANEADNGRQTGRVLSVTGLETGTAYYLRVRAYDNSNNYSPWTYWNGVGDDGDSSMANADSFTPTEITGTEIGVNTIKTGNIFAQTITAGDIATHTITAGQIEANSITADRIESNFVLVNHTISSNLYTAGSTGWMIDYGGTAEFNGAVTVRNLEIISDTGTSPVFESSFTIKDSSTNPDTLIFSISGSGDVEAYGNLTVGDWTSSSGKGMNWNTSTGELSIRGVIGIVGGWTIDAAAMYVGSRTVVDGYTSGGITFSSADGGSLHAENFYLNADGDGAIGGWNIDSDSIYTGTKDYSGFTTTGMTLYSGGSLHAKNFYINTSGAAYFKTGGTTSTAETGVPKLVISADSVANGGAGNIAHSWIQGYTGDAAEKYPGLLIFTEDGSTDGAVYLAAPRFTVSMKYAGFKAVHDANGFGYVTMGVVDKDNTFITTVASATSVTNVLGYGGLTLAQNQASGGFMPSSTNTLYRVESGGNNVLYWDGAPIGGSDYSWDLKTNSGSVYEITDGTDVNFIGGTNVTITRSNADVTFTSTDTQYTVAAPISIYNNIIGFSHILTTPLLASAGSNAAPAYAFSSDTHTGMYRPQDNEIGFSVGNSFRMVIKTSGVHIEGYPLFTTNGSAAAPSHSFTNDTDTGMYRSASNELSFVTLGAARLIIDSAGHISKLGNIKPRLTNTYDLGHSDYWWDYSYHRKMDFSAIPWASGSGYYMWMNTTDQVMHSSSSERIKKDIVTIPKSESLDRINALRPVEYTPRKDHSDMKIDDMWEYGRFKGFIAEEVAVVDHGYGVYNWWKSNDPESEDYDKKMPSLSSLQKEWTDEEVADYYDLDEARPQMFDLHAILADSVGAIQELSTKLEAAEARIAVLEG